MTAGSVPEGNTASLDLLPAGSARGRTYPHSVLHAHNCCIVAADIAGTKREASQGLRACQCQNSPGRASPPTACTRAGRKMKWHLEANTRVAKHRCLVEMLSPTVAKPSRCSSHYSYCRTAWQVVPPIFPRLSHGFTRPSPPSRCRSCLGCESAPRAQRSSSGAAASRAPN